MWKQVNSVLSQLSPITKSRKSNRNSDLDSADASAVELSVRHEPLRGPAVELQSLPVSRFSTHGRTSHDESGVENDISHPLASNGSVAHTHELPPLNQANYYNEPAAGLQPQASRHVASSVYSNSFQAVLRRLQGQDWLEQASSSSRLVLSVLIELAAADPLQQALRTKLQLLADSDSWMSACTHVQDADVLCVLAEHYSAAAATLRGPAQQQPPPAGSSLQAQFMAATATAAQSWPCVSGTACNPSSRGPDPADLQQLESCVVLGEALQLQQQPDSWSCLLQLVSQSAAQSNRAQQQSSHEQQQEQQHNAASVVRPIMHAWVAALLDSSLTLQQQPKQQPQTQHAYGCSMQLLPQQWDRLLAQLQHLQQQVLDASAAVSHPLQPAPAAAAAVSPQRSATHPQQAGPAGSSAQVGATSDSPADASGAGACWQQRHRLLQELCCGTVPALLQPGDLEGPCLQQHGTLPDGMALVVLLRLAERTSSLWLPLLRNVPSSAHSAKGGTSHNPGCGQASGVGHAVQGHTPKLRLVAFPPAEAEGGLGVSPQDQGVGAVPSKTAATPSSTSHDVHSPRSSWPDELLSTAQLWPGDVESEEDAAAITREERTLRCWINSVLHRIAGSSTAASSSTGLLSHSHSVDSGLPSGRVQLLQRLGAAGGPLRSVSVGGVGATYTAGAPVVDPLRGSTSGVFRCSSAGAAAAAATFNTTSGAGTNVAHSRSISADAGAPPADVSLSGWATEPAAPSTPTAAGGVLAHTASSPAAGRQHAPVGTSTAAAGPAAPAAVVAEADGDLAAALGISSVSSLFGAELRSGVLLLEILDLLQPGCVDWRLANKPPFAPRTAQLKALENCQLALRIAQEELGLPLVSMSPRDIVLGRRKIILSLVYQLMRYNTMQLLESISAVQTEQLAHQGSMPGAAGSSTVGPTAAAAVAPGRVHASMAATQQAVDCQGASQPLPSSRHFGGGVNFRSSSRKQRGQLAVTEQDILDWANAKLQQVKPLAGAGTGTGTVSEAPVIKSFKDPVLGSGVVLLQLLHVLAPDLVELSYVTAGHTAEQRQSNARYALALADKMGCSLFLVWEDLVDPPQPRMVLVLLASLMCQDLQRQQGRPQQHAAAH